MSRMSPFLKADRPALVLAPMEGVTDAPMRALQGAYGAFSYAVSEFLRVSSEPIPAKVFHRLIPELALGGFTRTGLPVQVQILGGDPSRMAMSAVTACSAGARGIDLNFGCPAPTVNRHDGGATLLKEPRRIFEVVRAVREAVPRELPVSAKLRLGWDDPSAVFENAAMAVEGGASWLCIHARTRLQGYAPPVDWKAIGSVRSLGLPVIANGDIWTLDDFRRCRDQSGCIHFMLGRGALANPGLSHLLAKELGLPCGNGAFDWLTLLRALDAETRAFFGRSTRGTLKHFKQWLRLASLHGDFAHFDAIKRTTTLEELYSVLLGVQLESQLPGPGLKEVDGLMDHDRVHTGHPELLPIDVLEHIEQRARVNPTILDLSL